MNSKKTLIGILVLAAVGLGAFVLFQNKPLSGSGAPVQDTTATPADSAGQGAVQSGTTTVVTTLPNLTPEQKKLLAPPSASAPLAEQQAYADMVTKAAQVTTTLSLGASCLPSPMVMSIRMGSTVTVKNTDSVDHTISFDSSHALNIPANSSKQLATDFLKEEGIHGYGCDSIIGGVGLTVVTK